MLLRTVLLSLAAAAALVHAIPSDAENIRIQNSINAEKRLIQLGPKTSPRWMSHAEILGLKRSDKAFMDVTNTQTSDEENFTEASFPSNPTPPTDPTQKETVARINSKANTSLIINTLMKLTSFHNRYYKSTYGRDSSEWLFRKVNEVVEETNKKGLKVSVTQFKHDWGQHSIVARIEGLDNNQETVIVGSHQDSINYEDDTEVTARAPGADDDGSGTVSVLETLRLLLADGYQPKRPVELHWYSGEEMGLLGSQAVAKAYREQGRVVMGMMQLDMTGYPDPVPDMGIEVDFVDPKLTDLLRNIAKEYSPLKTKDFK